jgi:cell wall integrity and stress response component
MISARILSALAASAFFTMVVAQDDYSKVTKPIPTPTTTKPANAMETIGCFETGVPLENHGPADFQSPGLCQLICLGENKPVMGLTDGTNCWCGDYIPPASGKVDNGTCSTTCSGTKLELCT